MTCKRLLAAIMVWTLLVAVPALFAEPRVWTTQDGRKGTGEFVAVSPVGVLVCKNEKGHEFTVPLADLSTNDLAFLSQGGKLGPVRDWKKKTGTVVTAHFAGLRPGGILLVTPAGRAGIMSADRFSEEDRRWLELEAPIPVEQRMAGDLYSRPLQCQVDGAGDLDCRCGGEGLRSHLVDGPGEPVSCASGAHGGEREGAGHDLQRPPAALQALCAEFV